MQHYEKQSEFQQMQWMYRVQFYYLICILNVYWKQGTVLGRMKAYSYDWGGLTLKEIMI